MDTEVPHIAGDGLVIAQRAIFQCKLRRGGPARLAYRTLIALNKIESDRVRRSIGALIEDLVGSQ